jgi:hypothetical protein
LRRQILHKHIFIYRWLGWAIYAAKYTCVFAIDHKFVKSAFVVNYRSKCMVFMKQFLPLMVKNKLKYKIVTFHQINFFSQFDKVLGAF